MTSSGDRSKTAAGKGQRPTAAEKFTFGPFRFFVQRHRVHFLATVNDALNSHIELEAR